MYQYKLKPRQETRATLLAISVFFSLATSTFVFADDVEAATEKRSAQGVEQAAQKDAAEEAATATAKQPKLMTMEEIYTGILEAEQQRLKAARPDAATNNKAMIDQWGVQIISVSYAADGFWLEFRFRVLDPVKANVLFDSKLKPYLESEVNGVKLGVPEAAKVGALRTTNRGHNIIAGKIYSIMFSNPGFVVQPGQPVTVAAGDFKAEHLTVRGSSHNLSVKR
jgi:hypothetical protein